MTGGLKLDLHVHSEHSPDGRSSVDSLVAALPGAGIQGLALTDHNSVAGHRRLRELARERLSLRLLVGVEVSTQEGHLLAYGLEESPPPQRPVAETIDWVEAHGGVPVLAHPFRWSHGVGGHVARTARVPAVESINGHNRPSANTRAAAVAAARALGSTGGSDAHSPREIGRARTCFPEGANTVDELLDALRRGATVAEGEPLGPHERFVLGIRTFVLRLGRGFRPI